MLDREFEVILYYNIIIYYNNNIRAYIILYMTLYDIYNTYAQNMIFGIIIFYEYVTFVSFLAGPYYLTMV